MGRVASPFLEAGYLHYAFKNYTDQHNRGKISLKDCEDLERPRSSVGRALHF